MKLSICCLTYNHEEFIRKAIDGFLMQDIHFEYEIIISDDASTDNTQNIIKEYQKRYPEIIKPYFNENNIGFIENFKQVLDAATGEYVAYCDGDDYWTNQNKIKLQIEALETNLECSFSFHDVDVVSISGEFIAKHSRGRDTQSIDTGLMNNREISGAPLLIVHANSLLFRGKYLDLDYFDYLGEITGGDFALVLLLCNYGNGYYFIDSMSAYRRNDKSISNSRILDDRVINEIKAANDLMDMYFNGRFHREIQRNYKGHWMNKMVSDLDFALESHNYPKSTIASFKLLFGCGNSQYSFRDVIWLLKDRWKKS